MRTPSVFSLILTGLLLCNKATRVDGTCEVDIRFRDLFLEALDKLESRIQRDVKEKIDDLGLGPYALPFSDIYDLKEDVFDVLLGDRTEWFDGVEAAVDVEAKLQGRIRAATGLFGGSLTVECSSTDFETLSFEMSFEGFGSTSFTGASIAVLPDSLPKLDVEDITSDIEYSLQLPFSISLNGDVFSLGETVVTVSAALNGSIMQDLPILPGEQGVAFVGSFTSLVSFAFSSTSELTFGGSYNLRASVDSLNPNLVANLALQARDDDFFDSVPPSVAFDFALCDAKTQLLNAISEFSVVGVIDQILDKYLDFEDNELLEPSTVQDIKDALVTQAQAKVGAVKTNIASAINDIDCNRRHLRSEFPVEVTATGDVKRGLQVSDTFSFLTSQIENLAFVSSIEAGYFPSRDEISIDLTILVEEIVSKESFGSALSKVFENLQGQSLFEAADMSDVDGLLTSLNATTAFTADLSFGLKVGEISSVLSSSNNDKPLGLFLRVDAMSLNTKVIGLDLASQIFGSVNIESGALELMFGVELAESYELQLGLADGSLQNGISFAETVTGRFKFEPVGHLFATLPLNALVNGQDWKVGIILEDEDLFSAPGVAAKIDFDACQVVDVFQLLLGKLGQLTVSMASIVGPSAPLSGINVGLDDLQNGFDDLLPDLGSYIEGALEAKNELFHICAEVEASGAEPPSIEDVIALIQEEIFRAQGEEAIGTFDRRLLRSRRELRNHHLAHTRSTRHQRHRALRAHDFPINHYKRPIVVPGSDRRRRRLQGSAILADFLDSLSVEGGFDGSMISVQLSLDVSKASLDNLADLLERPLDALSNVETLTNVFRPPGDGVASLDLDTDFSAGAHISVLAGCEIDGAGLVNLNSSSEIFESCFLQFVDASAKFEASATITGGLEVPGLPSLTVDEGSVGVAFGIGISEASSKIYFNEIQNVIRTLRQRVTWNKVGAIDISLPVDFGIDALPGITPIILISDHNLFDLESADISIDFDIMSLLNPDGEDFVETALRELTGGLVDISTWSVDGFELGPVAGKIDSILNNFELNFTSFIDEFKQDFTIFNANLADTGNAVRRELINLKPRSSFSNIAGLLQIGSRSPSPQLSTALKDKILLKLKEKFPSTVYQGVRVPGLPVGQSFDQTFPDSADFQIRDFLPAIAVAFGRATYFSDKRALTFSIDDLFTPIYGPEISFSLLNKIRSAAYAPEYATIFGRFDGIDSVTGLPIDTSTKEIFDVSSYLSELQVALQLAPSASLSSSGFRSKDIPDALFPGRLPTVKSFSSFIKRKIIPQIRNVLDFEVVVSPRTTGGLTKATPTLGVNGFDFGEFGETSTRLFPPSIDISDVQGFDFDLQIETSPNSIILQVDFLLNLEGVNPLVVLQDAINSVGQTLQSVGGAFEAIAGDFVDGLSSAGINDFLKEISNEERMTVALDAKIDASVFVELSFDSQNVSSQLREFSTALSVRIQDEFGSTLDEFVTNINAELALLLSTSNTAVPFDFLGDSSKLSQFDFQGSLDTRSVITVSGIPAGITLEASISDLTSLDDSSSVEFGVFLDIDLRPLREKLSKLLDRIDMISLPRSAEPYSSFLPSVDVSCIRTSGQEFLGQEESNSILAVSGFFDAIFEGCSDGVLTLTGGYDSSSEELSLDIEINIGSTRSAREVVNALQDLFPFSVDDSFFVALSALDISISGNLFLDISIKARGLSKELIGSDDYGDSTNIEFFFVINGFSLDAAVSSRNIDLPLRLGGDVELGLNDASFQLAALISLDQVTSIDDLFGEDATSELTFAGNLDITLPVEANVAGSTFTLIVSANDADIFTDPGMLIGYEYNLCEITTQVESLFDDLTVTVTTALEENLRLDALPFDISEMTRPIVEKADETMTDLKQNVLDAINEDCSGNGRMLQESGTRSSLPKRINDSLQLLSESLAAFGIKLEGSAEPSFDSDTFVASVDVSMNVTLDLSGSDILDILDRFLGDATSAGNLEALGLSGQDIASPLTNKTKSNLLNSTVVPAGFDVDFQMSLDIRKVQASAESNLGDGILESFALQINTWGAYALLIVDPIEAELYLSAESVMKVRDSSFSLAAYVRSVGSFVVGSDDISELTPTVTIPLNAELIFDLEVADATISPILSLSVDNIVDGLDFLADFTADLDLEAFLDGGAFGNEAFGLERIFDNVTSLLYEITQYSPELFVGDSTTTPTLAPTQTVSPTQTLIPTQTHSPSLSPSQTPLTLTPAAISGLFDVIDQASAFSEALTEFLSLVDEVQAFIPTELRSFVRQIKLLSANSDDCIDPSPSFKTYTFDLLQDQGLLPEGVVLDTYSPCKYLAKIQKALNFSETIQEDVDLKSLVIIDSSLKNRIDSIFGVELDIEEIIEIFETKSLLRLISFLSSFLESNEAADSATIRRRLGSSSTVTLPGTPTKHRRRLDLFRDVRGGRGRRAVGIRPPADGRYMEETTVASFQVGDYLEISANFNFGDNDADTEKQVTLTAKFIFDSDDGAADSIRDLIKGFVNDTLPGNEGVFVPQENEKSVDIFAQNAENIIGGITDAIIIDCRVEIAASFGLNLNDVFDESVAIGNRLPKPFLQINTFDVSGEFGLKEWSDSVYLQDLGMTLGISDARALVDFGASITAPITISNPSDFVGLIGPDDDQINLVASIEVDLPFFVRLDAGGIGLSVRVAYQDTNLFDGEPGNFTVTQDLTIATASIVAVAERLQEATSIFGKSEALSNDIPLLGKSLNDAIAGQDRTIADLFDLVEWAKNLNQASDTIDKNVLLLEAREELLDRFKPGSSLNKIPDAPDAEAFRKVNFESSVGRAGATICSENITNAIYLDIEGESDEFTLTICSLLGFEVQTDLNADGLLDAYGGGFFNMDLTDNTGFSLKGSLTFGARLKVTRDGVPNVELELDPLVAKLAAVASPGVVFQVGLLELNADIDALGKGEFAFSYQPSTQQDEDGDFRRLGDSSFFLKRDVDYILTGQASVGAEIPGLALADDLKVIIKDDDVFDDIAPLVDLPPVPAFDNLLRFSPANAVSLLRLLDSALIQISQNELFMVNLPVLNKKLSEVFAIARVFTSKLYEFFVQAEPFDDRANKSLRLESESFPTVNDDTTSLELYLVRDLTVNPIPENAESLRKLAEENGEVCNVNLKSINATINAVDVISCSSLVVCESSTCTIEEDEFQKCQNPNCDLVVGIGNEKWFIATVAYKGKMEPNDIQLLGIFKPLSSKSPPKPEKVAGIPVNSPVVPAIVPRFKNLQDLLNRMSQVLSDFVGAGLAFNIAARYTEATASDAGNMMFDLTVSDRASFGIGLDSSVSIGDLASIAVDPSTSLSLDAGFSISTQVGVLFEAPADEEIIFVGTLCDGETHECILEPFKFLLLVDDVNVTVTTEQVNPVSGVDSAQTAKEKLQRALDAALIESEAFSEQDKVVVSVVGSSTIAMAFSGLMTRVKLFVEKDCEESSPVKDQPALTLPGRRFICPSNYKPKSASSLNKYGFSDDIQKRNGFQFVVGSTAVKADIDVVGTASATANVGGVVEIGADIATSLKGDLRFAANQLGGVVPFNSWFEKIKSPREHLGFFRARTVFDGSFAVGAEVKEPFAFKVPGKFRGGFGTSLDKKFPFTFDLLSANAGNQRPELYLEIDLPGIGDIRNLSFGNVVRLLKQMLQFLIGEEEGDTVESCSGGLLGKELFGVNVFALQIPVIGVSACDSAGFLQVLVDAVDSLVNECNCDEEGDGGQTNVTFTALETKFQALLQDGVGGRPNVSLVSTSSSLRSILEVDIELRWSFEEATALDIDLGTILDNLVLDENIEMFAKSLLAFEGQALTDIGGELTLTLGIGLELPKGASSPRPFVKGITGLSLSFDASSNLSFDANVGPFPASVSAETKVDNYGRPLTITFGLEPALNYFLKKDNSWIRDNFVVVDGPGSLVDSLDVAVAGRVTGSIMAALFRNLGYANIKLDISDLNNVIQKKPGAIAVIYEARVNTPQLPSLIDLLLADPRSIVEAVSKVFENIESFSLGSQGVLSQLDLPFVKGEIARQLNAGRPDNPIRKAKRNIIGAMESRLKSYEDDSQSSDTVAGIISNELNSVLQEIGILDGEVTVTYFQHQGKAKLAGTREPVPFSDAVDVSSLMWTIPLGQSYCISLPELDFEVDGGLPLQLKVDSEPPKINLSWGLKLAFGFDEEDGFFLYTFPEEDSEFKILADFDLKLVEINAILLYFLDIDLKNVAMEFGAGITVDIDKERALREPEESADAIRYGRVSNADFKRIINKKDLFQITAIAAATLEAESFATSIDIDPDVNQWLPSLTGSVETFVKKEIGTSTSSNTRGRRMNEVDRRWLSSKIMPFHHRGLRVLCEGDSPAAIPSSELCPVNVTNGEFACARLGDITLDLQQIGKGIESVLGEFVNDEKDGLFDEVAKPLLPLDAEVPGLSELSGKRITTLDVAEIFVPQSKKSVDAARKLLEFYRTLSSVASKFDGGDILLAEQCIFRPGFARSCTGGIVEGDGSADAQRLLMERELFDEAFPTYDLGGNRITPARLLQSGCSRTFAGPECSGHCNSCTNTIEKSKCLARLTKCKAQNTAGLSFPFLEDLAGNLALLSGGDVQIVRFTPPPLTLAFYFELGFILYTPPDVLLTVFFEFSVTLEYGVVLDTKGIRQAIQESNPLKALNSFAFIDRIDGVDVPLVVFEATIGLEVSVSAVIVKISVSGGITFTVVIDFYDPYPDTSGGLIRPYEMLSLSLDPLDWFEITATISAFFSVSIEVGIFIGFFSITLYEQRVTFEEPIFGPITRTPRITKNLGELDTQRTLVLTHSDPVTCISQAGTVGSESIICFESNNGNNPAIREYVNVKSLDASSVSRRQRSLLSSGFDDQDAIFNDTQVIPIYRDLQPFALTALADANTFSCVSSPVNLGPDPRNGVILNYMQCRIGGNSLFVTGEQILVGTEGVVRYGSGTLARADIVLPSPGQDLLKASFTNGCRTNTVFEGFTNLFIQANLVEQGCGIKAKGTSADAILEIDFGYESNASCNDGFEVILEEGLVTIKRPGVEMKIEYGSSFRDILIKMSNCNDIVSIHGTFSDSSSVEVWGGGGNDSIFVGSNDAAFEESIHANIIVHGNNGDSDTLTINDSSSLKDKVEVLRPKKLTGLHATGADSNDVTKSIDYDGFKFLNIDLSQGENDLTVVSTETASVTRITTGSKSDVVFVESTDGELFLDTFGGEDTVTVLNAQADFHIDSGSESDVIFVYGLATGSVGTIYGGSGDDTLTLDGRGSPEAQVNSTDVLKNTFDGSTIRWSGGENDDTMNTVFTSTANSNIDIFDDLDGNNFLNVDCANFACYVLSRENFLANIHDLNNTDSTVERINIDRLANGEGGFDATARISSVFLNMNDGENKIFFDDSIGITEVFGGSDRDEFRVGQLYNSSRDELQFVRASDPIETTLTTKGYLSNGNSHPLFLNGRGGDDFFEVLRNKQILDLNGNSGDDLFIVRSFIALVVDECTGDILGSDSEKVTARGEEGIDEFVIEAGGRNNESVDENSNDFSGVPDYVVNSLVDIDGGTGVDTLIVVGTEEDDTYVVTDGQIFGGGLSINFANLEIIAVDGLEGNDHISVLSTSPEVSLALYGNKGSDRFEVAPTHVDPVVSKNLRGHRGILEHAVRSELDEGYENLLIEGVAVDVMDNDGAYGYINFVESEHQYLLFEDDGDSFFTFTVFPTRRPQGKVSLNIVSQADEEKMPYMVLCPNYICSSEPMRAVGIMFEAGDMTPQVIQVKYNTGAVPLSVTDENLAILSVVEVEEELTADENFRRTEQSLIPINVKLIPAMNNSDAKAVTVIEHEPTTSVAEGPNGFDAKYDIFLRPCTSDMKDETLLNIIESVPGQLLLNKNVLNGDDWGSECKFTVTVTAVDDYLEEGDHFVTLTHTAFNKSDGQPILLSDDSPLFARSVLVRIYDDDVASVIVDKPLGYVATAEIRNDDLIANDKIVRSLYTGEYRLRLSKMPSDDVSITIRNEPTATDRLTPTTAALNRNYEKRDQLLVNGTKSTTLIFNSSNWFEWQTISVAADDDDIEEGVDLLYFASQPSYLSYIQGPISIFGEGGADIPPIAPPLLFPGETDEPNFTPPCGVELNNGTLYVIEENQVDYLIINNFNARGSETAKGFLTFSQFTGMNMGRGITIAGVTQFDGIYYEDMEVIEMNFGNVPHAIWVQNTSAAVHVLNLGIETDSVFVEEISGPFIVRGGAGSDVVTVASEESKLDKIQALLSFDGGEGGEDELVLVNTNDIQVDDVLNVTRFVIETASMGFDNSSYAPEESYWINLRGATSGTFTLELYDPVSERYAAESINFPTTEKELEATLQRIIIRREEGGTCGSIGTSICADAVKVYGLGADAFLVFFLGERLFSGISLNLTDTSLDGFVPEMFQNVSNDILLQHSDILYMDVESLTISMGDLDVVLNIRGTSASTHITTHTGDDTVFISSEANQNTANARTVDVLLGWLDYIEEDLAVDVGTGRHRLLISDEKSRRAKGRAVLTNNSLTDLHEDLGDIFFHTRGDFAWAGGVDLWLGKAGDKLDVLSVPSNPDSPPLRTITCVHAGDGDDTINIALDTEDHDGAVFVANGQAGSDIINATLSTHPVILFGGRGSDTLVGGSGSDILFGDLGRVLWLEDDEETISVRKRMLYPVSDADAAAAKHGDGVVAAQVGNGGYGDFSDGIRRNVSTVLSMLNDVGDDDTLECGDGDNVGIGGFGSDTITGGGHRDILFGDSAEVNYHKRSNFPKKASSLDCCFGDNDTIFGGDGEVDYLVGGGMHDVIYGQDGPDLVFGDHAVITFDADVSHKLMYARTTNHSCLGGNDTIFLGHGDDIAFGGSYSDKIDGGPGQDILFGDFGEYDSAIEFLPFQNYRSIITDPDHAGDDQIYGQEGDDIIFGQEGSDFVDGGPGNDDIVGGHARLHGYDSGDVLRGGDNDDVIAGDNAQILRIRLSSKGTYPWHLESVWKTYPEPFEDSAIRNVSRYDDIDMVEGNDVIFGDGGNDVLIGQGGNDTIEGGEGEDEVYGGHGYDDLDGGAGNDILLGDNGYAVRRFDPDGKPVLQTDLTGFALSPPAWLKDIILEDVGRITQTARISTKVDTNSLFAENTTTASLIFVANAYEGGAKVINEAEGGWPTYMILFDLVESYDDVLTDVEGINVLIGQRGDDSITGKGLLIGDAGRNSIPLNTNLPRIHQIYRALSLPAGSVFAVDDAVDRSSGSDDIESVQGRHLRPIETGAVTCNDDLPSDDPNLINDVSPPEGSDFGVTFAADFDLFPSQYRYVDYLSSIIDTMIPLSDVQVDGNLVKDLVGASTLSIDNGLCLQPMFRISPGLALPKQHIHGNDKLQSTNGASIVVGDDIYGSAPFDLTELKAVGDSQSSIDILVFNLGKRLSTLEVDTQFFQNGVSFDQTGILVGSDRIRTSMDGQAFVIGDFLRLYARSFLGSSLTEEQVVGMVDRLRDIELVLIDTHLAFYELHENLLLRTKDRSDQKRQQKSHYNLTLASDTITSSGDGDLVIGDSSTLFTQVDRLGEDGFEFEDLLSVPNLRALMQDRDDERDRHVEEDLIPSLALSESNARKLPYADVPFLLTACTDHIDLTSAHNLAAGDYGFLGFVSSSQPATSIGDAYVDSIVDLSKRPGVASFLSNPTLLKYKIPFFYQRYSRQVAKEVEPTLFGDFFFGSSPNNLVLGEFVTAVGAGQLSAGPGGFLFDAKERGVFATYDNAEFATVFDGDTIDVVRGTVVDGQKGKDVYVGNVKKGKVDAGPIAEQLFYDNTMVAQWITDAYSAAVSYSTFAANGLQHPQCLADLFNEFIPPDIQGGIY